MFIVSSPILAATPELVNTRIARYSRTGGFYSEIGTREFNFEESTIDDECTCTIDLV